MVLEQDDQLGHVIRVQLVVHLDALLLLDLVDKGLEGGLGQLHNDVREHLDEAAVGVTRKARVICQLRNSFADFIVHAEVEDGIHHARHGSARARAHGYEQGLFRVAQRFAGDLFQFIEVLKDLLLNIRIDRLAILIIPGAGLGGNGETLRHRHAEPGHFRQVRALAAEQLTHLAVALREHVNILLHLGLFLHFVWCLLSYYTLQSHKGIISCALLFVPLWYFTYLLSVYCAT